MVHWFWRDGGFGVARCLRGSGTGSWTPGSIPRVCYSLMLGVVVLGSNGRAEEGLDTELVGYWKLAGDCQDYSGKGNHGRNHGVDFSGAGRDGKVGTAACFDGVNGYVEVPHAESLALGTGDFSVCAWVHTEEKIKDNLGDVLSKYDPALHWGWDKDQRLQLGGRRGFNFVVMNYASACSAQSNYRNVLFGIDNGKIETTWTDCGRPGRSVLNWALTVYEGHLYAGTFEWGAEESGHVYRYAGGTRWVDCGSPDKSNSVCSLAVYQGRLYAATTCYPGGVGTSFLRQGDSPNKNPGGRVYRYEGGTRWTDCGKSGPWLLVFDGKLYGGLSRYDGGQQWTACGSAPTGSSYATVYNGSIYTGYYGISRFDGDSTFTFVGKQGDAIEQTYGLATYQGRLYAGTFHPWKAEVWLYDGDQTWNSVGRLGNEQEVMGMIVYNGKLYAGSLPLAQAYRYDEGTTWTNVGQVDPTPTEGLHPSWPMRRAWSMAVYDGKLYCGVMPSGLVKSFEAGKSVTYDYALAAGWKHLVGVRDGGKLKLYIDGQLVKTSTGFNPADYDLSNNNPLRIGFGQHDYFCGRMSDVRIYRRALTDKEVTALYAMR